jgi:hypothetical protein
MLIAKGRGVQMPKDEYLENSYDRNPDGAGIAVATNGVVRVEKGLWSKAEFMARCAEIEDRPALIHCRLATHGSIKPQNCHPFYLKNGAAFAHNGILNIEAKWDTTDSETFARKYVEPISSKTLEHKAAIQKLLSYAIGKANKAAILLPTGKVRILNCGAGEFVGNVWFSNAGYRPFMEFLSCGHASEMRISEESINKLFREYYGRAPQSETELSTFLCDWFDVPYDAPKQVTEEYDGGVWEEEYEV